MTLKHGPRKVDRFRFKGSANDPINTPTSYRLMALDMSSKKWKEIMSGRHPKGALDARREHVVNSEHLDFYQDYRLVVDKTVWMENNAKWGYVQMSYVELCWDANEQPPLQ